MSTVYKAKYFDGMTPAAYEVEVVVKNAVLEITKDGNILDHWPLKLLFRDETHLTKIVLGCQGEEDSRLELYDPDLLKEISLSKNISGKIFLSFTKKDLAMWIGGIVMAVFLLILSVKPLTRFMASQISHQTERSMLNKITELHKPSVCELDMDQAFALEELLGRIYPLSEADKNIGLEVHIVDTPEVNAYALPGAQIWLFKGLIKNAESPEELVGILAHEIEHIKQRHVLETIIRGTLFTSVLSMALGDASGALIIDPQTAMTVLSLGFDRDMESRADAGARERLKTAQISNKGLIDFFERNKKSHGTMSKFISTHPSDEDRIARLKEEDLKKPVAVLSPEKWKVLKSVCSKSFPTW